MWNNLLHPLLTYSWSFHLRGWWTFSNDVSLSLSLCPFLSLLLSSELGGWMLVTFSPVRRNNGKLMLAGALGSWITVLWENVSLNYWIRPCRIYKEEHHASSVQQLSFPKWRGRQHDDVKMNQRTYKTSSVTLDRVTIYQLGNRIQLNQLHLSFLYIYTIYLYKPLVSAQFKLILFMYVLQTLLTVDCFSTRVSATE